MVRENKRKLKKIRGENEPKKPTTEYFMFLRDERKNLQPGLSVKEQTQILSKKWSQIPPARKMQYAEEYAKALAKYKVEIEAYKQTDEYREMLHKNQELKKLEAKRMGKRAPRKPSGYNLFVKEQRAKMNLKQEGENEKPPAQLSFKEISQQISKNWHELTEEQRTTYKEKAKAQNAEDEHSESTGENDEPAE